MLVNCSNCRTPLQLPAGAKAIRCALCHAVTHIAEPRNVPPSPYSNGAPPANPLQYSPSVPSAHGSKRALIVGISYKYSRYQLKGCINDAKCMKFLLMNKFQFPESSILMLTGNFDSTLWYFLKVGFFEERDPLRLPTKQNMRMAMFWLVQGCKSGDSLVFHYSGHGSQQRDYTGEEVDGYDETLCPVDFETQGMLVDNELNATLVRPLPRGVKLHCIIDACHSGTALDLPFLCKFNSYGQFAWEDHRPRSGAWKGTGGGDAFSFSGCDDGQTSADTSALSKVTSTGAMTYCFIQAIEHGHKTYGSVLNGMRQAIRNANTSSGGIGGGGVTTLIGMLLTGGSVAGGLTQEPQLTSANLFDINMPFTL
ncbi:hypothetical protein SELMODRAFT_125416 [Selaginella moellendorffii]|uniref:Uncharacterized protein n=1 Tax=Selaginella moellendorffii TaxID=88036 RepID=D8SV61_SELML|nr:hypothetical protein SELMODRAFT_125416 [Selaginella moellendorffii]